MSRLGVVVLVLSLLSVACGVMSLPVNSDVLPTSESMPTFAQKQPILATFEPSATARTVYCVSAAESLNLRLSPSTSAEADSAGLQHGDRVERIGDAPGWYKIVTADGRRGWVKASYLEECDGT